MRNVEEIVQLPETTTLGNRLKYLRLLRGMSQQDLARRLSPRVHIQTVSAWETGANEPRRKRIAQIASVLKAPVPWLVEGKGDIPE